MKKLLILTTLMFSNTAFADTEEIKNLAFVTVEGVGVLAAQHQGTDDFKATVEAFMDEVINGLNKVFGPGFYANLLMNKIEPKLNELSGRLTTMITDRLSKIEPKKKFWKTVFLLFPGLPEFLSEEVVAPLLNNQLKKIILDVLDGSATTSSGR